MPIVFFVILGGIGGLTVGGALGLLASIAWVNISTRAISKAMLQQWSSSRSARLEP